MILTLAPSDVYGPSAWYFIYQASARGPVSVLVHNEFSCK